MTDKTPSSLMEWAAGKLTEPPRCEECERPAVARPLVGNVIELRRDHAPGCSAHRGREIVKITQGNTTSTAT